MTDKVKEHTSVFEDEQKEHLTFPLGALDILVLDDNPSDFELLSYHLRQLEDLKLHYASNFPAFKSMLKGRVYSAIICDYGLGPVTGVEAFEYVRDLEYDMPFIMVSGALGEDRAVEILRTGVTDYVLKDKYDKLPFVIKRAIKEYEAKRSEVEMLERIKESESKFREIFDSIIDVYFQSDLDGIQRILSPSVENIVGYKPKELIGIDPSFLYKHPEQRKEFLRLLKEQKFITDYEIDIVCKDGALKQVSTNAKLMFNDKGVAVGLQGVYRDITQRKRQEEILIKREAQLRESQLMANLGSWEFNMESRKFILSQEFFKIFELPVDKKEREDFYEFAPMVHPDDRARLESNLIKFMKTGNELPYEFRIITPSGKLKYLSTKVFKSRKSDKGDFLSGIVQDITDLKLLEEEKNNVQRQALEMLEEMVEQRTKKIEEQRSVIEQKKQRYYRLYKIRQASANGHYAVQGIHRDLFAAKLHYVFAERHCSGRFLLELRLRGCLHVCRSRLYRTRCARCFGEFDMLQCAQPLRARLQIDRPRSSLRQCQ